MAPIVGLVIKSTHRPSVSAKILATDIGPPNFLIILIYCRFSLRERGVVERFATNVK